MPTHCPDATVNCMNFELYGLHELCLKDFSRKDLSDSLTVDYFPVDYFGQ